MPSHRLIQTEDGSPSLETTYPSGVVERMHHFRGAWSETLYIYGPVVDFSLSQASGTLSLLSLGLGLGYVELMVAAAMVGKAATIQLVTSEIDPALVSALSEWLEGDDEGPWAPAYSQINELWARHFTGSAIEIRRELRDWRRNGRWQIRGRFPECLSSDDRFDGIFYDAFSRKMDEDLWSEAELSRFIKEHTADHCAFATYAATGALKRSLRLNGFSLQEKIGFGGKKESTFATR